MGLLSALGTIGGSLLGGPAGGAIGGALGGLFDGSPEADAAKRAAAATGAATDSAIALQREMWQAQQEQQRPWLQAGQTALNKLVPMATEYTPFGVEQFQQDPGYAFRLSEGQKAMERSTAARAGLQSGSALKAASRFGQEMGSQEYQNAFNRYQTERQARLGPLQSLAGVGQTAANTLGGYGQAYAGNVGQLGLQQGYTTGNALLAGAQARQSQYGDIGKALGQVSPEQWKSAGSTLSNWLGFGR